MISLNRPSGLIGIVHNSPLRLASSLLRCMVDAHREAMLAPYIQEYIEFDMLIDDREGDTDPQAIWDEVEKHFQKNGYIKGTMDTYTSKDAMLPSFTPCVSMRARVKMCDVKKLPVFDLNGIVVAE